jgi:WD40 repeat protein
VVASAVGQRLKVIPGEEGWTGLVGWLDNQRVVINLAAMDPQENTMKKPSTLLLLNPFSGERQILRPDYPKYYDKSFTTVPDWEGWGGVVYDPTFTRAIYPRLMGDTDENYTYALWDLSKKQLVTTLEEIFSDYAGDNIYPMPRWSPDGSQFVVDGLVAFPDHVESETYLVSKDGLVKQLNHLYPYGGVFTSISSWSPDGRYLATYLATDEVGYEQTKVVVVDIETLDITDFCLPITYGGEGYGIGTPTSMPVWSPDGTQFLVVDWYSSDHQSVILVDIAQGFAAKIAEDMQPVGWMLSP